MGSPDRAINAPVLGIVNIQITNYPALKLMQLSGAPA